MALTQAQKAVLNRMLAQYPSSSTNPTLLADMWELLPVNAQVNAAKALWKSETAAKVAALQAQMTTPFTEATDTLDNS
jgi:hypothetical protein